MKIIDNFLRYVSIDTTSNEVFPDKASNINEYDLANLLYKDLIQYNPDEIFINKFGTVHALFKAEKDLDNKNAIALLAHMDTSNAAKGSDIKPGLVKNYNGEKIELSKGIYLDPKEYPSLIKNKGHDLIVTDGTTLLGGDDKAGIAIIMEVLSKFDRKKSQRSLEIIFTTDEEIGVDYSHVSMDKVVSKFGYTLDGGDIDYIAIENFNAMSMEVSIKGISFHPGDAKNKLINALNIANEYHNLLPETQRPENTENKEGFYHLCEGNGEVEKAHLSYIIRDFDKSKLNQKVKLAQDSANYLNEKYGYQAITIEFLNSYENMKEVFDKDQTPVDLILDIYKKLNLKYEFEAIRGGTTGAHLAFMGLPCPNLGTGTYNMHSRFEYVDVNQMLTMVNVVSKLFE